MAAIAKRYELGQIITPYDVFCDGNYLVILKDMVERGIITITEKAVLKALNAFSFKDGKIFPKQSTLAKKVGLGERQTINVLKKLEEKQFISIDRPSLVERRLFGKSNRYHFLFHAAYFRYLPHAPEPTEQTVAPEVAPEISSEIPYIGNQEIRKKPGLPPEIASETPEPAIPLRGSVFKPKPVLKPLKTLCDKINNANRGKDRKRFNPEQAVNQALKSKKHPEAIREALESVLKCWPVIRSPWGYFNQVLAVRSGNYHERQHRRATEALKTELIHAPAGIRALVAGIGAGCGPSLALD